MGAPDGRVTAVWTRYTGNGYVSPVVEARQLTTATGALSPTVTVADADARLIDAARDAQGRVTVLYRAGGSLKARRIYPDLSLSPELTIVTNSGTGATIAAADAQGRFLVAWSNAGVRARILDLDGALSPTVTVAGGLSGVAVDPTGGFGIVSDGGTLTRVGVDGTVGAPLTFTTAPAYHPRVIYDQAGRATITWSRADTYSRLWLQVRQVAADHVTMTPIIELSATGSGNYIRPALAVDPAGSVTIAWTQHSAYNAPDSILLARLTNVGTFASGARTIATGIYFTLSDPVMTLDQQGRATVAWVGSGGLVARRFTPDISSGEGPQVIDQISGLVRLVTDSAGTPSIVYMAADELRLAQRFDTAPVNVIVPTVSETPIRGYPVYCLTGSWRPSGAANYQWRRDATPIPAATGSRYTLTAADVGHQIDCEVTETNDAGGTTAQAAAVTAAPAAPDVTSAPVVTGTPTAGETLHCTSGEWTDAVDSYTYRWLRDLGEIADAASADYTIPDADIDHDLTCEVVALNETGRGFAFSAPVLVRARTPVNTQRPAVIGTPRPAEQLTCAQGAWNNQPASFDYQWLRDGVPAAGATGRSYTVDAADPGHELACRVTATNSGGSATAESEPITALPANTARPVVVGDPVVYKTLVCNPGEWSGEHAAFEYRWLRDGAAINGATVALYTVSTADVQRQLSCEVTASNAGGQSAARSDSVYGVAAPAPAPATTPQPAPSDATTPPTSGAGPSNPGGADPGTGGAASKPSKLRLRVRVTGRRVTATVTTARGVRGRLAVTAKSRDAHRRTVRLRGVGGHAGSVVFAGRLPRGRWIITAALSAEAGWRSNQSSRTVRVQ